MSMEEMIGYCGYNCHLCPARSDDPTLRQELVEGWKRLYGHENYTAENVQCCGCKGDGATADKECQVRPCAQEKGLESCADCEDFACPKLKPLIHSIFFITDREYDVCMRQFHAMPNLVRRLAQRGKLPSRLRKHVGRFRDVAETD